MADPARELEAQALELPRKERARLAERLISSLDQDFDPDAEKLWLGEAERRLDELESGKSRWNPRHGGVRESPLDDSVRSVEFHREAQDEFIAAAQYFESQTENLGLKFIAPVERQQLQR